jgi:hypothetical protein
LDQRLDEFNPMAELRGLGVAFIPAFSITAQFVAQIYIFGVIKLAKLL